MMDSLDNLSNNLSELNECKNCKEECNNYTRKKNVLVYQCKKCNKKSYKSIDELIENFSNSYSLINDDDLGKFLPL